MDAQRRSILRSWKLWLVAGPVLAYVAFDALMLVGIAFGPAPLRTCALILGPAVQPMPSERQLVRMLDDPSDWVRECAVIQIKMRGLRLTCDAVAGLLDRETSCDVLVEIDEVLSRYGGRAQVPAVVAVALQPGRGGSPQRYARHILARLTRSPELAVFRDDDLIYDPALGSNRPPPSDSQQIEVIKKWWATHRSEYESAGE